MANATQPGDGKTSPLGNGQGGSEQAGMATGNDFVRNPRGNPAAGATPPDFTRQSTARQKSGAPVDLSTADAAAGGRVPMIGAPATRPGGVGTPGNSAKPYKLGG